MLTRSTPLRAVFLAFALAGAAGCGVGSFTGPGGGDDDGDGSDADAGDGGGGGNAPDAFPAEPIICATEYVVTGTLVHDIAPIPGESCDGSGTWTITVGEPAADDDYTGCAEAPGDETFQLDVTGNVNDGYAAADLGDGDREWTAQIRDKGGNCAATFKLALGDGAEWALIPSEDAPGGPLDGTARYEIRSAE